MIQTHHTPTLDKEPKKIVRKHISSVLRTIFMGFFLRNLFGIYINISQEALGYDFKEIFNTFPGSFLIKEIMPEI